MSSKLRVALCASVGVLLLAACVPSPTATPPRQTPFPTLPLLEGTPTQPLPVTSVRGTPGVSTPRPSREPSPLPIPTNVSANSDTLAPIVQLTIQDPELPVSTGQNVPLNALAADNNIIARFELYDGDGLYAQAPVLVPSQTYLHQFTWQADTVGAHTLRVIAYDAHGNPSAPAEITVNVITNNRAPSIQITSPSGTKDAEIGAPILIQGVATDDVAVTRMELIVDNQLVTFVVPDKPGGVTPFAVSIPWTPTTTGAHSIVLRAYDNQNQSDDSLRYTINVFDNQLPVVTAQSEYAVIPTGEVLVVNALALASNGINRVELYVDERQTDARTSSSPAQQTSMQATLSAPDLPAGTHTYFVRAFDLTGQSADSPRATIEVRDGAPRILRETPTAGPRPPLQPTRTATPELVLPSVPTIELELVNQPVVLPASAQIEIIARGSSELDRVELWARAPGESSADLVLDEVLKGATEKAWVYEWKPPHAGVVEMYARVYDNVGQSRLSQPLRFSVLAPAAPTPPPAVFDFARTWFSESPAARFEAEFAQIGRALRGAFLEQRADGTVLNGKIVSGTANDQSVLFAVDFALDPDGSGHTLEFDCSFNARPPVLTCNYSDQDKARGSAVFQPLNP